MHRRELLRLFRGLAASAVAGRFSRAATKDPLPVAAVVTAYKRNSHADVIVGKILEGYDQQGGPGPNLRLVAMYTDQTPANDMSRDLARQHGFRIARSIDEALTLGRDQLQVAGVLSIGEHGDYPYTEDTGQHMYPRRRFFDEIVATFQRVGQVVPVFNDKHLAYAWSDAKHMFDTARRLRIPMLAGSSLPVTWREPPWTPPRGAEIEEALAVGYGGLEAYGFHALETLQCQVERRAGGETGVRSVATLRGEAIWRAHDQGQWSADLLRAALRTMPGGAPDDLRAALSDSAAFYRVHYRDGLNATVAMANGVARHFGFAARLRGRSEPVATWFRLQDERPYGHFAGLTRAIDQLIQTGEPPYPVERTLLTTGVLDAVMHSLAEGGGPIDTPWLDVRYDATDWPHLRE